MRFREFPVHIPTEEEEGPSFRLGSETFHCVPQVPAGAIADCPFYWPEAEEPDSVTVASAWVFVVRCVVPGDSTRLHEACLSRTQIVRGKTLVDIARWLVEEYTPFGRGQLASSANGLSDTGTT